MLPAVWRAVRKLARHVASRREHEGHERGRAEAGRPDATGDLVDPGRPVEQAEKRVRPPLRPQLVQQGKVRLVCAAGCAVANEHQGASRPRGMRLCDRAGYVAQVARGGQERLADDDATGEGTLPARGLGEKGFERRACDDECRLHAGALRAGVREGGKRVAECARGVRPLAPQHAPHGRAEVRLAKRHARRCGAKLPRERLDVAPAGVLPRRPIARKHEPPTHHG